MKEALINYVKNGQNDEIYTPDYAVEPLLKYLPKNLTIWEPTDFGASNITKVLKTNGYKVISTHKTNLDFLEEDPDFDYDMIITNPPYSIKDDFLARCYKLKKPFCLLLPLTALEGVRRGGLFRQFGISVIILDRRINFTSNKGNWFNASWFVYNVIENNSIIFEKLEEKK